MVLNLTKWYEISRTPVHYVLEDVRVDDLLVEQMLVLGYGVIRMDRFDEKLHLRAMHVMTQGVEVEFNNHRVSVKDGGRMLSPSEFVFLPDTTAAWAMSRGLAGLTPRRMH